jgi:hypothetical protein
MNHILNHHGISRDMFNNREGIVNQIRNTIERLENQIEYVDEYDDYETYTQLRRQIEQYEYDIDIVNEFFDDQDRTVIGDAYEDRGFSSDDDSSVEDEVMLRSPSSASVLLLNRLR